MESASLRFLECIVAIITLTLIKKSQGHGFMIEPPSRSSMWRVGFPTPINYDDNAVRCEAADTNCRVCGNKDNEAGGRYATGIISRNYIDEQVITLTVVITANHMGYFEFGLCPNNDIRKPVTEECLNEHILKLDNGETKFKLLGGVLGPITLQAKLPQGVTCSQCVLRWYWKTGNSWGIDPTTGIGCIGCGNQERFFGCSDVSISPAAKQITKMVANSTEESSDEDLPEDSDWK